MGGWCINWNVSITTVAITPTRTME